MIKALRVCFIIIILVVLLLVGCDKNYDFEDENIAAYVNGEPVYELEKEQFISIKKVYMQAVYDLGSEPRLNDDDPIYEDINMRAIYVAQTLDYKRQYEIAARCLAYSEKEWDRHYYTTFVIAKKLFEYSDIEQKEILKEGAEQYVLDICERGPTYSHNDELEVNIYSVIDKVAKANSMTFEECAQTIYKPFAISMDEFVYLEWFFVKPEYKGEIVEFDGKNEQEYRQFVIDAHAQYDLFIEELYEQAEIVEASDER